MKKRLLVALLALLSIVPAMAAKNFPFREHRFSALGAHLTAGDDLYLGVHGMYNLDNPIRLEGRASVMPSFLPDNLTLTLNGHYLFPMNQFVALYPLVGVEVGIGRRYSGVGANFGGGAQFELADRIFLTTELTAFVGSFSSARLSVGLNYRL